VFSAVGLALDLIGAVALVLGLFRPPRPLFVGWAYEPLDAARDVAFGVTGGTFLAAGFVLQSLSYVGFSPNYSERASLHAALVMLPLGTWVAIGLYGVTFLVALPREIRYSREKLNLIQYVRWEPKGLRFWCHVAIPPPESESPSRRAAHPQP
jgi:hypothetical protein